MYTSSGLQNTVRWPSESQGVTKEKVHKHERYPAPLFSMPIVRITRQLIDEVCGSFSTLTVLNLSRNEIDTIENLERLQPSLTKLDIGHNLLRSALGLEALTNLVHLELSGNRIESLAGLDRLHRLEVLTAADNSIASLGALRSLSYLARLTTVTLAGNPLALAARYREDVARRVPSLLTLDGSKLPAQARLISSSDRAHAQSAPASPLPDCKASLAAVPGSAPSRAMLQTPPSSPSPRSEPLPQAPWPTSASPVGSASPASPAAPTRTSADVPSLTPTGGVPAPTTSTAATCACPTPTDATVDATPQTCAPPAATVAAMAEQRNAPVAAAPGTAVLAIERTLALERQNSAKQLRDASDALEEAHHRLERERRAAADMLHARDVELGAVHDQLAAMREELRSQRQQAAAELQAVTTACETERATCRKLRAYVAGCAQSHGSTTHRRDRSQGGGEGSVESATAQLTTWEAAGDVVDQTPTLRAEAAPAAAAYVAAATDDTSAFDSLREEARAAAVERDLLQMRLDAMGHLMALQEEALLSGLEAPVGVGDSDGSEGFDRPGGESTVDEHGEAPASNSLRPSDADHSAQSSMERAVVGEMAVEAQLNCARAMARGWRIKAHQLLEAAAHARATSRCEVSDNLAALEASAEEIRKLSQRERLLEAKLALASADVTAARVGREAALEEAASSAALAQAADAERTSERAAARDKACALRQVISHLGERFHLETSRLNGAISKLCVLDERLNFAVERTKHLAGLKKIAHQDASGHGPAVIRSPAGIGDEMHITSIAAAVADGSLDVETTPSALHLHLKAEISRLSGERAMLLRAVAEKEAACERVATDATARCEAKLCDARAATAACEEALCETKEHVVALETRCAALIAERDVALAQRDSAEVASASAAATAAAHAELVSELQAQAACQRRIMEEAQEADRAVARAEIEEARAAAQEAREEAERAIENATACASEHAAAVEQQKAAEQRAARAAEEATCTAQAAANEAALCAQEREALLEREAGALKRELVKETVARRSLEREVTRLRAASGEHDTRQFEYLEEKLAARDQLVASLRKERNALLASLRSAQWSAPRNIASSVGIGPTKERAPTYPQCCAAAAAEDSCQPASSQPRCIISDCAVWTGGSEACVGLDNDILTACGHREELQGGAVEAKAMVTNSACACSVPMNGAKNEAAAFRLQVASQTLTNSHADIETNTDTGRDFTDARVKRRLPIPTALLDELQALSQQLLQPASEISGHE